MSDRQPVAVVTGGGGGIGAAIAMELGRGGWHVVTVDPLVTVDGSGRLPDQEETTASRIVAAGGSAVASPASVTDAGAVRRLFESLAQERGGIDAVINVAGISRPTGFAKGAEGDWKAVLSVHLEGYLNVLSAALPLMEKAGRGRIVGVTSGSGWRAADAGAYSCAKRAVAALTWQLAAHVPAGVTICAMSPIALTRMVTSALQRSPGSPGRASTGQAAPGPAPAPPASADPPRAAPDAGRGLSLLGSMPDPDDIGPLGAFLAAPDAHWVNGHIFFAGGSEVAVIEPPRLIEVVQADDPGALPVILDTVLPKAFAAAEAAQASAGGGNPRFGGLFAEPGSPLGAQGGEQTPNPAAPVCAIVADEPALAGALTKALEARSVTCHTIPAAAGFEEASAALTRFAAGAGALDAVVVAVSPADPSGDAGGWVGVLDDHRSLTVRIHADALWSRAAADYATSAERAVRVVTLVDARTPGGRSRAQAAAQLARAAAGATKDRVAAFAVALEGPDAPSEGLGRAEVAAELAAHLVSHPEAVRLAGAELVTGPGWIGLRSHPRPVGSVIYGGPELPPWLEEPLREVCGGS